ncbi:hypothetical protein pb186bvf_006162 [Paramecium bursaria]
MQYYRFKAIIAGEQKVGKKSLLSKIDQGHEENRIVLVDKISQTLFVFEFIRTYEYQPDALFYLYIYDQTNEKTFTTIQEKLLKLNIDKSFQFIVLICNKCDLANQIQYDIEHYATQNQFIYIQVSALTGKNITLLQNILRIKTAQTMKKCKIQPIKMDSLQNSPKLSERPLPKTPKTPTTPQTPQSFDTECKSIQSEVVYLEDMEPQIDIGIKRVQNSIKKLNQKIENKLDSTIRIYRQQSPKYSQRVPVIDLDTTSRSKSREDSKNKFPDHLNPRVYGRNLKPLLTISFQIDSIQDMIDIDVYQDDTLALITDRLQVQCGLKFNQVQKKLVQQVVDQKLAQFRDELQRVVANSQRRNLKIKEQVENFITYFNHDHKVEFQKFQQNRLKKSAQGQLIVTISDKVFELFIFPNMDAYETGFQAILDFGLKKNMIEKLVSRIQIIQNTKTIRTLCIFDFIDMELIIYQGENIHKYLFILIKKNISIYYLEQFKL